MSEPIRKKPNNLKIKITSSVTTYKKSLQPQPSQNPIIDTDSEQHDTIVISQVRNTKKPCEMGINDLKTELCRLENIIKANVRLYKLKRNILKKDDKEITPLMEKLKELKEKYEVLLKYLEINISKLKVEFDKKIIEVNEEYNGFINDYYKSHGKPPEVFEDFNKLLGTFYKRELSYEEYKKKRIYWQNVVVILLKRMKNFLDYMKNVKKNIII